MTCLPVHAKEVVETGSRRHPVHFMAFRVRAFYYEVHQKHPEVCCNAFHVPRLYSKMPKASKGQYIPKFYPFSIMTLHQHDSRRPR